MVAVTDTSPDATPAPAAVDGDAAAPARNIGVVPTASMLTGAAIAVCGSGSRLAILIVGISSIPVGHRLRLVGRGVRLPDARRRTGSNACAARRYSAWASAFRHDESRPTPASSAGPHQLWLDVSSARFWKASAHHYLRMTYDMLAAGLAFALLVFAFLGPAAAIGHPAQRRRRRAVVHVAAAGLAAGRRRGGRRRGDPGLRARRRRRRSTAGCCRRRRQPRCSTRSARLPTPGTARCRRRRPNGTASSAICTTACSRDWCRWP